MAFTVPNKEVLRGRLQQLLGDYAREKWLPLLLRIADQQKAPVAVIMHLQLTAHDAFKGLPEVM